MRWRSETRDQLFARIKEWQRWFAWYPVKDRDHGYRMWFEFVLYKWSKADDHRWDYRPITILESDLKSQATIDAENSHPQLHAPYGIPGSPIRVRMKRPPKIP